MENTTKYRVSFWRSGARKPSGSRFFDTEEQAYAYFNQYTRQDKVIMEEEWGTGASAEIKLEIVSLNENGMEVDAQAVDSMHVVQQDAID
ncbi:hypothetical protein [Catalinimonas niigatensis]|uniref:hypothetical protein n=1 Tax=Catalinimonas niigatensis TaxID=1397264 RepID=UPI0026657A7E|nr:hypothetical protein [Catalinimonas niigatensis]WPP52285.1 hypothetical protein PZB72_07820 [Catalinimonas niigatensis]